MSFIGRTLLRNAKTLCTQIVTQQQKSLVGARRSLHCTSPMLNLFVQKKAPDFKGIAVVDGEFQEVKLADYQGKYLVLFFYPLDFTFVCPTELIAFSKRIQEFKDLCAEVVGVSVDSHFAHLSWTNMEKKKGGVGPLCYPILSDLTKQISRDYNVLLEDQGVALRGTFIIDDKGIVRSFAVNDLPVGRSVDEVLRLIKAFQFVDKNGEVCPANWDPKKNPDTIKPDVNESKEYFDKHG